jgi:hypothetical protein
LAAANASTFTPATLIIPFTQNMVYDFGDRVFYPYFIGLTNCELGVSGFFGEEGVPESAGCDSGNFWTGTIKSLTGEVILGTLGGEIGGMGGTFFLYGYWFSLTGAGGGGILTLGSIADIFAPVGILVSDLWILLAIAIGIPLAFYIIKRLIALMPKK